MSKMLAFVACLALAGCATQEVVLSGPSGKYEERYLNEQGVSHLIVVVQIVEIAQNETWLPAAYVEFRDGIESPETFRIAIFQKNPGDDRLIVGFEEMQGETRIAGADLGSVGIHDRTRIGVKFLEGRFDITVNGVRAIAYESGLKTAVPLIRASNCVAQFET